VHYFAYVLPRVGRESSQTWGKLASI